MNRRTKRQSGFTLIEVLVALAIFAIVITASLLLYSRSNRVFKESVESAQNQQSTRIAFDKLVSDIRMAGFDFDRDGVPAVTTTDTWKPTHSYTFGDTVIPATPNGYMYRCKVAGTSGAFEPAWQITPGQTFTDGGVTWVTQGTAQFQQPDEQIEYAGATAITIRGNFNYNDTQRCAQGMALSPQKDLCHGREPDYEPALKQFPIVTTSNNEIVTYALKSADSTKNTQSISFWVDNSKPRNVYPGGSNENKVTISGIDLTNNNPPYTLYRFTLDDTGAPTAGVPVADNIRSLTFTYYQDPQGKALLTNANGSAITAERLADGTTFAPPDGLSHGAIGGAGQYKLTGAADTNLPDRGQRSVIQAIAVRLTGMNESPDAAYTNPTETSTSVATPNIKQYRQYPLSALVVPRNIGLSGLAEIESQPPSEPTVTAVCVGHCRAPVVFWAPPASGFVDTYEVCWDTSAGGTFPASNCVNTSGPVLKYPIVGKLTSGVTYYFKVAAINENGRVLSNNYGSGTVINATKPAPPSTMTTTTTVANQVDLTWNTVTTNDSSAALLTCNPSTEGDPNATNINGIESINYRVYRGTTASFDPTLGQGTLVLDQTAPGQPVVSGNTVSWSDSPTNSKNGAGPANCVPYFYRLQAYDQCAFAAAENSPANVNTAQSTFYPPVGTNATPGSATTTAKPSTPGKPTVNTATSSCGGALCTINLSWPAVTTDVNGKPVYVANYDVYRYQSTSAVPPTQPSGMPAAGWTKLTPSITDGSVTYSDNSGPSTNGTNPYYYSYVIVASQCLLSSAPSTLVTFPTSCPISVAVSPSTTQASPADMDALASVQVQKSTGIGTISKVVFTLFNGVTQIGSATTVTTGTTSPAPCTVTSPCFTWGWGEQDPNVPYYTLKIDVTDSSNCVQTTYAYLHQEPIPGCDFNAATTVGTYSVPGNGANKTSYIPISFKNNTGDILVPKKIQVKWTNFGAGYTSVALNSSVKINNSITPAFASVSTYTVSGWTTAQTAVTTIGGQVSGLGSFTPSTIAGNAGVTYWIGFDYKGNDIGVTPKKQPIASVCLEYTIANYPNDVFHCNIFGQATPSANPGSCD